MRRSCLLLPLALCGCVSVVSVQKVTSADQAGIRYYLPEVFIQVTPKADGTIDVKKMYLPDPDQQYVINTRSYLGNYTIDINLSEEGFLDGVTFEPDTTAVAKQLISTAGTVRAAEIEAQTTRAKAEAADAKAAAEKAKAAIEAAEKAYREAELGASVAAAKLRLLQEGPPVATAEQLMSAKIALKEAELRRDAAKLAYTSLLMAAGAATPGPDARAPLPLRFPPQGVEFSSEAARPSDPTFPEPIFYRAEMTPGSVTLREAFPQAARATWTAPSAMQDVPFTLLPNRLVVRPAPNGALTADLTASHPMIVADVFKAEGPSGPVADTAVLVAVQPGGVLLRVDLQKDSAAGDYLLELAVGYGKREDLRGEIVELRLRVEK